MVTAGEGYNAPTTGYKRSKDGCQTCRHRKKKCDELRPTCSGCMRNNLSCQWLAHKPQRQRRRRPCHQNGQLWPRGVSIPQSLTGMVTVFAVPSRRIMCRLLVHFTHSGPLWMSIGPGRRDRFLRHVAGFALENPLTLNCILAMSAADLVKYDLEEPELGTMALEFYGSAIAGLSARVKKELIPRYPTEKHASASDDVLLAILLLCVHEAHNFSDASRMFPHLNAAAVILRQQRWCFAPRNPELRAFLLEIFCYFFALVAFSHGSSLNIAPAAGVFELILVQGDNVKSQSLLLGPSQELIATIFRVSMLTHFSNKPMDDERRLELARIELQLQSLDTNVPTTNSRQNNQDDLSHDDLALFKLYRLACLIYVKGTLDPRISPRDPSLQQIVISFVNELGSLPGGSSLNGLLVWPLVIAGLCAVACTHQRIIIGRFRTIYKTWRTDIMIRSMEFLRDRWKVYRELERASEARGSCFDVSLASYLCLQDLRLPAVLV